MKLITPAEGTITVSRDKCPDLFNMTRVGLGALGIVSEVTLQLVPAHHLLEHTFIMSSKVRTHRPCSICPVRPLCWSQALWQMPLCSCACLAPAGAILMINCRLCFS